MNIEKLATSAVEKSIAKTERLDSFINSGDKEPAWDGNIYIYKDAKKTKVDIKKVSTQVKGKAVKGLPPQTIEYRIATVDLQAYLNNGGTMFFVVYIDPKTQEPTQIYYSSLLPFKIIEILKVKKPTQKSFNVKFQKFPEDNIAKTEIFLNHYSNAQYQISFVGKELPTLEELKKRDDFEGLVFKYTQIQHSGSLPIEQALIGKEVYFYAKMSGNPTIIPAQYVSEITVINTIQEIESPVFAANRPFYASYHLVSSNDMLTIKIGNCITFEIPKVKEKNVTIKVNCTVKIQGTLNQRIVALDFLLSASECKEFYLGTNRYPFDFPDTELEKIGMSEFPNILSGYKRAKNVLNTLHVKKDLDLDKCDDSDIWRLNSLVDAIENGTPIKNAKPELPIVVNMRIANICVALIAHNNNNGTYTIWDYFNTTMPVVCMDEDGNNKYPASQFAILKKNDFLTIDNIFYENILLDYQRLEPKDYVFDSANNLMLEMLKAYDENSNKELFVAIKNMSDWLSRNEKYLTTEVVTLNSLQIIMRERSLTYAEKTQLHRIIATTSDDFFKLGAFILLGETEEADKILSILTEEQTKTFTAFPLYKFYTKTEEKK